MNYKIALIAMTFNYIFLLKIQMKIFYQKTFKYSK